MILMALGLIYAETNIVINNKPVLEFDDCDQGLGSGALFSSVVCRGVLESLFLDKAWNGFEPN